MTSFIFEMNAGVRAIRESWIFVRTAKVLAWYEQLYAVGQNWATSDCVRALAKYPNGYLLYGCGLKHEFFFRRNEILFYAKNQRKFTYLTSEASSIIEFELIFGIIKDFIESKKIHVEDSFHAICNFVPHLTWLWNFPECFWARNLNFSSKITNLSF